MLQLSRLLFLPPLNNVNLPDHVADCLLNASYLHCCDCADRVMPPQNRRPRFIAELTRHFAAAVVPLLNANNLVYIIANP